MPPPTRDTGALYAGCYSNELALILHEIQLPQGEYRCHFTRYFGPVLPHSEQPPKAASSTRFPRTPPPAPGRQSAVEKSRSACRLTRFASTPRKKTTRLPTHFHHDRENWGILVAPSGIEPELSALRGRRVNQLHHGARETIRSWREPPTLLNIPEKRPRIRSARARLNPQLLHFVVVVLAVQNLPLLAAFGDNPPL